MQRADGCGGARCGRGWAELGSQGDVPSRVSRAAWRPLDEARVEADVGCGEGWSLRPTRTAVAAVVVVVTWRGLVGVRRGWVGFEPVVLVPSVVPADLEHTHFAAGGNAGHVATEHGHLDHVHLQADVAQGADDPRPRPVDGLSDGEQPDEAGRSHGDDPGALARREARDASVVFGRELDDFG